VRVSEGQATFKGTKETLWKMHQAEFRGYLSMLDKTTNANTIQSLLIKDRVIAATINTLFGFSNATILSASQTITIVVDYVNTSSKATHTDAILGGTNILKYLYNYCLKIITKQLSLNVSAMRIRKGVKKLVS